MNSSTRYSIGKPEIIREQFDEEVVIVDLDTGSYYSLGGAGGEVWSAIESGASRGQIVEQLSRAYSGEKAEIESSITCLLDELQREELIVERADASDSQSPAWSTPEGENAASDAGARAAWQAPVLEKYTDMQALLLLDPIHEVDSAGWPQAMPEQPIMMEAQGNPDSIKA